MSIKAVLFDLDGTLLPMNQDRFIEEYFKEISSYLHTHGGYEPKGFMRAMWQGIGAMIKNDGTKTNEDAFWLEFIKVFGEERVKKDLPLFDSFYKERFSLTKSVCGYTPYSRKIIDCLKEKGITVALATNPVFPEVATKTRMGWVDLTADDFVLVTTYENIGYCKPNPDYYRDIAKKIGALPSECLMVGNDTSDDLSAALAGMDVYLVTDCLINTKGIDIESYKHGNIKELYSYITTVGR